MRFSPSSVSARCALPPSPKGKAWGGCRSGQLCFFRPGGENRNSPKEKAERPSFTAGAVPALGRPHPSARDARCHLPPRGRHGAGAGRGSFASSAPGGGSKCPQGEGKGDAYRPKVSSGGKTRAMRTGQRLPLGEAVAKRLMRGTVVSKKLRYPRPRRPRSARSVPPCASRAADRDARRRPCRG